ncbi:MAG: ATP-binding protein [Firmicutes bacterium]|nr:ATP-binding protein [Bacillota bacterium]
MTADNCSLTGKDIIGDFVLLSRQMLHYSNQGATRLDFLRAISEMMINYSGCSSLEVWARDENLHYRWKFFHNGSDGFSFRMTEHPDIPDMGCSISGDGEAGDQLFAMFCDDEKSQILIQKTRLINDGRESSDEKGMIGDLLVRLSAQENSPSLLWLPFAVDEKNSGILILKSETPGFFSDSDKTCFEGTAQTAGIAIANRRAQVALRERFKELRCMYGICQIINKPHTSLDNILHSIVKILPPAMQYPEICYGRIIIDGRIYSTPGFPDDREKLSGDIIIDGILRGNVEVAYGRKTDELEIETFLREEKALMDNIARQLALIVERKQAEEEKARLEEQLRHSDRLATIGQLAAGVAHELNEPIGNILGFAQLAAKTPDLPEQAARDMGRIIESSLNAREIVKKLLTFARQAPARKITFNLNNLIEQAFSFFKNRFTSGNIKAHFSPAADLPDLSADPGQINQVFINLVVNGIQAMPDGGSLYVSTYNEEGRVCMSVRDTGSGMSDEVLKQIFVPFFTTKKIGQGTGLGLSLVHGIISSHNGKIEVKSNPGEGTEFIIRIPV